VLEVAGWDVVVVAAAEFGLSEPQPASNIVAATMNPATTWVDFARLTIDMTAKRSLLTMRANATPALRSIRLARGLPGSA
jgi:hypothetical protein